MAWGKCVGEFGGCWDRNLVWVHIGREDCVTELVWRNGELAFWTAYGEDHGSTWGALRMGVFMQRPHHDLRST